MPDKVNDLLKRLEYLEDRESVRSLITKAETLRDGTAESVDELMKLVTPDVRFFWSLEKIEVKGIEKLRENLKKPPRTRVWSRHVITNLQVEVQGKRAEASWYVMAEGVSNVDPAAAGDEEARHRSPASPDTVIHNDTKGAKRATLVKTKEGWKIQDYTTDMVRLNSSNLKIR